MGVVLPWMHGGTALKIGTNHLKLGKCRLASPKLKGGELSIQWQKSDNTNRVARESTKRR